jgi:hypothetical protein
MEKKTKKRKRKKIKYEAVVNYELRKLRRSAVIGIKALKRTLWKQRIFLLSTYLFVVSTQGVLGFGESFIPSWRDN